EIEDVVVKSDSKSAKVVYQERHAVLIALTRKQGDVRNISGLGGSHACLRLLHQLQAGLYLRILGQCSPEIFLARRFFKARRLYHGQFQMRAKWKPEQF